MNNLLSKALTIVFIICIGCGTEKKSAKIENFTLTVEFEPAVFMTGRCIIEKHNQVNTLSLDLIYGNNYKQPPSWAKPKAIDPKTLITNLPLFIYGDTILLDSIETVKLDDEQVIDFIESLPGDLATQTDFMPNRMVIDGYRAYFNYRTDSINHNFSFSTLSSNDKPESQILIAIIDLMDRNLKSEISRKYIRSWKIGFGLYDLPNSYDNLPILKINVP